MLKKWDFTKIFFQNWQNFSHYSLPFFFQKNEIPLPARSNLIWGGDSIEPCWPMKTPGGPSQWESRKSRQKLHQKSKNGHFALKYVTVPPLSPGRLIIPISNPEHSMRGPCLYGIGGSVIGHQSPYSKISKISYIFFRWFNGNFS